MPKNGDEFMNEKIEELIQIVKDSKHITFFGGAGVSTESNIPDFRSENGLYKTSTGKGYPPETLLSHSFYKRYPEDFYAFYKEKMIYPNARPNAAHRALAKLEQRGKLIAVITQNIDGLHQLAASLIHYFKGKHLILINKSSTSYDSKADLMIREAIGKVLEEVIEAI